MDDTKTEKFGKYMEFIHKLFDHAKHRYILGYNPVLILAVFGDLAFPMSFMLWLPKTHPHHRSKNDLAGDFITHLQGESQRRGCSLAPVEILFDSAYCVQKVVGKAQQTGLTVVSKPSNTHKFEFDGQLLTPKELIEKVKERAWKPLGKNNDHQRFVTTHPVYGPVVLIVRRRVLKNGKITYDVIMSTKGVYNGLQINTRYRKRWAIEIFQSDYDSSRLLYLTAA